MPNNSKPANAATNVMPAGKLEGTGLAGANGGQAKSANKMNIVANKLIKALNKYMEAPKDAAPATSSAANKQLSNPVTPVAVPSLASSSTNNTGKNKTQKNVR